MRKQAVQLLCSQSLQVPQTRGVPPCTHLEHDGIYCAQVLRPNAACDSCTTETDQHVHNLHVYLQDAMQCSSDKGDSDTSVQLIEW
jgi:hypothetical protein